jgi:hypothetical protein
MLGVAPKPLPPYVDKVRAGLATMLAEAQAGLVSRLDEGLNPGAERSFDIFVDLVWAELRRRVEFRQIYGHPGTVLFDTAERQALDFDERVEQAQVASRIHARIFGDGLEFLRTSYPIQANQMAARLAWIADKELDDEWEQLVGHELATLVRVCQVRYQAMVDARGSRDGKAAADIRELRHALRRRLYAYCGAVGSLYDPDEPGSQEMVEDALRPILIARNEARRRPAREDEASDAKTSEDTVADAGGEVSDAPDAVEAPPAMIGEDPLEAEDEEMMEADS